MWRKEQGKKLTLWVLGTWWGCGVGLVWTATPRKTTRDRRPVSSMKPKGLKRKHWWRPGSCLQQRRRLDAGLGWKPPSPSRLNTALRWAATLWQKTYVADIKYDFRLKTEMLDQLENHGKVYLHHFCLHSFAKLTVDLERHLSIDFSLGVPHPSTKNACIFEFPESCLLQQQATDLQIFLKLQLLLNTTDFSYKPLGENSQTQLPWSFCDKSWWAVHRGPVCCLHHSARTRSPDVGYLHTHSYCWAY